ncbi:MAG TPA: DUF4942 domain-containing protein [Gemmataceae bacterium]|nr:DUF4942 domain-containing protein [Gemmataceae bacterium]
MFDTEFYPTPAHIAHRMLAKVSRDAEHFLEPSAGKGDIAIAIKGQDRYTRRSVDCIEQCPELASILIDKDLPVVGHDWLEYAGACYYDAILMNPPFSNGDEHLLKAWDFLHNGEIVCLLNEETIKNPHTETRKRLATVIEKHGNVEYLGDCFSTAERRTDVNVAMVYLKKEAEDDRLDLWAKDGEEKVVSADIGEAATLPALIDRLGNMQHFYDQANEHMLKAFQHIRKASLFLQANDIGIGYTDDGYKKAVALAFDNLNSARAEFSKKHRRDAWMQVFEKMEFRKWLDKKQTEDFVRDIERNGNIPFTKENIKGTLENVFLQRRSLFEKSVANVFDELTSYFKGNTNHTEGWKTNDSYKVNEKLVFPYGCKFEDKYGGNFSLNYGYRRTDIYNDLDRIMCVLDGKDFADCHTIGHALDNKFHILGHNVKSPFDNTTESRYFSIRFFKKGTVHLVFKDKHLWQEFNLTAAKGKNWIGQQTQTDAA